MKKTIILLTLISFVSGYTSNTLFAQDKKPSKPRLCRGKYQSEEQAVQQLKDFADSYSNLEQWKQRADNIRQGILRGAGLAPMPKKTPLNPIIHSKRRFKGYTVENVAFESLPGFFATGNLYRPAEGKGPYPLILCTHGHFPEPNGGGRLRDDMQIRCATLARAGAIVLSIDMIGYGDSKNIGFKHRVPDSLTMQLYNCIRAIDFLTSLKNADQNRIAVTGASGGGTQTILLAALDDRVTVSVPVVMVAAHFFGGCVCESGMPIHLSDTHQTNNAEIAALAAPRPQLLVSDGKDWTKNTPNVELPYIRNVYNLYGAGKLVENVHLPNEGHDYGPSKRQAAYKFLAQHLNLSFKKITKPDGSIDESNIIIEKPEAMYAFNSEHPLPANAVKTAEGFHKLLKSR